MEAQLQSTRILLQLTDHDADLNSLNQILQKLGHPSCVSESEAWEKYLLACCNEIVSLSSYIQSAEPVIVPESEKSEKYVILNHMNLEQTSIAASLIELVSVLGLVPFLSFSVPLESRKPETLSRIRHFPLSVVQTLSMTNVVPLAALKALYACIECRELHQMAIECAMVDMIPAFIKLGFEKLNLPVSDVQWCNASFKRTIGNPAVDVASLSRILLLHLSLKPQNQVAIRVLSSSLYMLLCERTDGFTGVLSALLDSKSGIVNMEAVAMASKTIAIPPERIQIEGYFAKLIPQFLVLLRSPYTSKLDKFVTVISEIFSIWSLAYPTLTTAQWLIPTTSPFLPFIKLYFLNREYQSIDPLQKYLSTSSTQSTSTRRKPQKPKIQLIEVLPDIAPIKTIESAPSLSQWNLRDLESFSNRDGVIVPQQVLEITVSNLTLLLYAVGDGEYLNQFEPVLPTMVALYTMSTGHKSRSVLESDAKDFLQRFFKLCAPELAIRLLNYLTFHNEFDWRRLYADPNAPSCRRYEFSNSEDQLVLTASSLSNNPEDDIKSEVRMTSDQLVQLLKLLDSDLVGIFFLKLLEDIWTTLTITRSIVDGNQQLASISAEENLQILQILSEKQIKTMHVLLPLIEQLGPSVLRNTIQICVFVKNMLENDGEEEIQALSLSILKEILETGIISRSEADILLFDLLTPLKVLFDSTNEFISELAQHCFQKITDFRSESSEAPIANSDEPIKDEVKEQHKRRWVLDPHASNVEEALKMISTPLVPIRAGGLIQLRRLLLKEDADAMARLPFILDTFVQHLSNEDSYVYLGAIQGLSAIADVQFSLAMPKLAEQYRSTVRSLEIRLNIGEAILQVARRLGSVLPKYAKDFFSLLLYTAQKDPDALMRASSLSNIAEVCEILRYGLLPYIEEIMAMIYDILFVERDDHVRRGCVNLVKQLFKGLEKDSILVIPSHLKRIVPLLTTIQDSDRDLVLREHARIAIQLYESGIESKISEATQSLVLDPQGFYSSLRFVK